MLELLAFVFSEAGDEAVVEAADCFGTVKVDVGTEVIVEGADDQTLFIVIDGELDVRRGRIELMTVRSGAMFGEMGLFGHPQRINTVKAAEPSTLMYIHREGMVELQRKGNLVAWVIEVRALGTIAARLRETQIRVIELARNTQTSVEIPGPSVMEWLGTSVGLWGRSGGDQSQRLEFLKSLPHFAYADANALEQLAGAMNAVRFREGQFICRDGDKADSIWLLVEGKVDVVLPVTNTSGIPLATMLPGQFFGVSSMLHGEPTRTASCKAVEDTTLLMLSRATWEAYADDPGQASSSLRTAMIATLSEQLDQATQQLEAHHKAALGDLHEVFSNEPDEHADDPANINDLIFKN